MHACIYESRTYPEHDAFEVLREWAMERSVVDVVAGVLRRNGGIRLVTTFDALVRSQEFFYFRRAGEELAKHHSNRRVIRVEPCLLQLRNQVWIHFVPSSRS
jgi:hypothetical protein